MSFTTLLDWMEFYRLRDGATTPRAVERGGGEATTTKGMKSVLRAYGNAVKESNRWR